MTRYEEMANLLLEQRGYLVVLWIPTCQIKPVVGRLLPYIAASPLRPERIPGPLFVTQKTTRQDYEEQSIAVGLIPRQEGPHDEYFRAVAE